MLYRVGGRPTAILSDYFGQPATVELPFPFSHERRLFYFSARYALAGGIQALGLQRGDKALLPSYNCGVEIEPFHYLGIQTDFYRIDKNLQPDLDDIRRRLRGNVKALLVTHFLGFPQLLEEIRSLCFESGVYLIEDCAHALLSAYNGKYLGESGDISIFSIIKTLPVPNGGVLVLNNDALRLKHENLPPSRFSAAFYVADLYRQKTLSQSLLDASFDMFASSIVFNGMNIAKLCIAAAKKISNRGEGCLVRPDSLEFRGQLIRWGMSGASHCLVSVTSMERIRERRRANFCKYLDYFVSERPQGITLPFTELPEGVCPLFFPLIFEGEGERELMYINMKKQGITTHPWWDHFHPAVPWQDYPEAAFLKKNLFGLPVHQDLDSTIIDQVLIEFAGLLQR